MCKAHHRKMIKQNNRIPPRSESSCQFRVLKPAKLLKPMAKYGHSKRRNKVRQFIMTKPALQRTLHMEKEDSLNHESTRKNEFCERNRRRS